MSGLGERIKSGPTFGLKKQHLKKSKDRGEYSYEAELLLKPFVTPDDIMRLPRITQSKLYENVSNCSLMFDAIRI